MSIIYYARRNNPVLVYAHHCNTPSFQMVFQGLHSFAASEKGHEGRGSSYAVGCRPRARNL